MQYAVCFSFFFNEDGTEGASAIVVDKDVLASPHLPFVGSEEVSASSTEEAKKFANDLMDEWFRSYALDRTQYQIRENTGRHKKIPYELYVRKLK